MAPMIDEAVLPALRKSVNPPLLFWMGMKMLAGVGIVAMPVLSVSSVTGRADARR